MLALKMIMMKILLDPAIQQKLAQTEGLEYTIKEGPKSMCHSLKILCTKTSVLSTKT